MKTFKRIAYFLIAVTVFTSCSENLDEGFVPETILEESDIAKSSSLDKIKFFDPSEGMFVFDSFNEVDELTNILMSADQIETIQYLNGLYSDYNVEIQLAKHLRERLEWNSEMITSSSELKFSEIDQNNNLFVKDYNLFWAISNGDHIFKVDGIYYLIDEDNMYSAETKDDLISARGNPGKKATLFNNELSIYNPDNQRALSDTLWTCDRSVNVGTVTTICIDRVCCDPFVTCLFPCDPDRSCFPSNASCLTYVPCTIAATQEFTGKAFWYTFKTYYCGSNCPYMQYNVTVNYSVTSDLPGANLSGQYSYKLDGTPYTLSGSGSSSLSVSLTHNLGLIGANDPCYHPQIFHVSGSYTGTAANGATVTCN